MEKICLSQRRIDEIKNVCRKYGNDPGELINILHGVQDTLGYLPKEVQELIALELGISAARVYGVVWRRLRRRGPRHAVSEALRCPGDRVARRR